MQFPPIVLITEQRVVQKSKRSKTNNFLMHFLAHILIWLMTFLQILSLIFAFFHLGKSIFQLSICE